MADEMKCLKLGIKWTEQSSNRRSKKRKAQSSKGSSSEAYDKVDIDQFKTLSTDEKLSALFTKFTCNDEKMEAKMNECLQISSDIRNNKSIIDDHEARLLLLEYKSVDLKARSRRNNLLFNRLPEERNENCATLITNFLRQSLSISSVVRIGRVDRLGLYKHDKNRQIIGAFRDYKDVQEIMANGSS